MLNSNNIITTNVITNELIKKLLYSTKYDSVVEDSLDNITNTIHDYVKLGPCYAAILGDDCLAIGGIGKMHSGVGAAWLIINKLFLNYPKSLLKISRQIIKESWECLDLHRIHIDVDTTFDENHRFAKKLGFVNEGVMKMYGPNKEDYCRYVMLRK